MLPLVLITQALPDEWLSALDGRVQAVIAPDDRPGLAANIAARLPDADGLLCLLTTRVDEAVLDQAPHLKVVSNMAVGVDNIDLSACTRRGIPVGNTPGVLTEGTADLAMALMLAAARKLPEASRDAREGRWTTWSPTGWLGADLYGATLGIIGLGKIGRAVAQRASAFGMQILYTDRAACETPAGWDFVPLDELLARSDFVTLHTPLVPETRHLMNARTLRLMKPTATLINSSRGPVVDTDALEQALRQGWIAAAALDVTDPEPLPPDHPLYTLPNCLIVPHIGSATRNTRRRMCERAVQNLLAGLSGARLPFCANPEVYDEQETIS